MCVPVDSTFLLSLVATLKHYSYHTLCHRSHKNLKKDYYAIAAALDRYDLIDHLIPDSLDNNNIKNRSE